METQCDLEESYKATWGFWAVTSRPWQPFCEPSTTLLSLSVWWPQWSHVHYSLQRHHKNTWLMVEVRVVNNLATSLSWRIHHREPENVHEDFNLTSWVTGSWPTVWALWIRKNKSLSSPPKYVLQHCPCLASPISKEGDPQRCTHSWILYLSDTSQRSGSMHLFDSWPG